MLGITMRVKSAIAAATSATVKIKILKKGFLGV